MNVPGATVGAVATASGIVWVADPAGVTSAVLRWTYRTFRWLVRPGSEQSYVAFTRWSGVLGILIGLTGLAFSLLR
jgi:hypothetical protein